MSRALLAVLTVAALAPVGRTAQQPVAIKVSGFIMVNTFREYSDGVKAVYVMGVIDGMDIAPVFGAPGKRLAWLNACSQGMNGDQVAAIVDKYLRDHPEYWHEPMNIQVYGAMQDACKAYRR